MYTVGKTFVGFVFVFALIGVYAWFDRERTMECRIQAVTNGADTVNAVKLCKN